ncbi:MAG: type II toxin-antitoxin system VapC family toxin [Methanobacteriaceae archaeon]
MTLPRNIKPLDLDNIKIIYKYILENCTLIDDYEFFNKAVEECLSNEIAFYDSMYIVVMKELGITKIVSFDTDFNNIEGIERIH